MEQAVATKDIAIADLKNVRDHFAQKEREWEQRQVSYTPAH